MSIIKWVGAIAVLALLTCLVLPLCLSSDPFVCRMSASWKEFRSRGLRPFQSLDVTGEVAQEISRVGGSTEFIRRLENSGVRKDAHFDPSCKCRVLTLKFDLRQHVYLALTNESYLTIEFEGDDEKDQVAPKLVRATVDMGWSLP